MHTIDLQPSFSGSRVVRHPQNIYSSLFVPFVIFMSIWITKNICSIVFAAKKLSLFDFSLKENKYLLGLTSMCTSSGMWHASRGEDELDNYQYYFIFDLTRSVSS